MYKLSGWVMYSPSLGWDTGGYWSNIMIMNFIYQKLYFLFVSTKDCVYQRFIQDSYNSYTRFTHFRKWFHVKVDDSWLKVLWILGEILD